LRLPAHARPFASPPQPPRPRAERLLALALAAGLPLGAAAQDGLMDEPTPPATAPAAAAPAAQRQQAGAADKLPVDVQADRIGGRPDVDVQAEGDVDARRGDVRVQADRATFRQDTQVLKAQGNVRMEQRGNRVKGTELEYKLDTSQGYMLEPEYFIALTKGGGTAERVDFLGPNRARIIEGTYTSCGLDGEGAPAWLLSAERVDLDLDANEGVARGGVLRFMGVPILAAPRLSFPLSDERKSGWLPPLINIDNRNGLDVAVPYYWNIAPNRDATFTPTLSARRGPGLNSEYRYLEPTYQGRLNLNLLPNDRVTSDTRYGFGFDHNGTAGDFGYHVAGVRVSDDDYWKDFSRGTGTLLSARTSASLSPRLLQADMQVDRGLGDLGLAGGQWTGYARSLTWQVLQDVDPAGRIIPPYERLPQIGVQGGAPLAGGLRLELQTELNRFSRAPTADPTTIEATRWHALGSLSRPWRSSWGWFTPKLSFNAASYSFDRALSDGRTSTSRLIPTVSADTGLVFERPMTLFGRELRQTLEPRLLYVRTPYHEQAMPLFDTAVKDFNITSLYAENAFTGVDRVSDANQLTAGVTTRLLDQGGGNEVGRIGIAQRVLFSDQRITPDGQPITQRLSDLLLLGSSMLTERWSADGSLQYNHQTRQVSRSVVGARYSPGPFRTLSLRYRFTRDSSEQVELGWQWPVYGTAPGSLIQRSSGSGSCGGGTLFAVGRTFYSTRDRRLTDGIGGFEYDAGCWIFRAVGERISTGTAQATTRLMLQLELVGLSRLGTNPLQVLRSNIPGYRLLREDAATSSPPPASYE
jgi:LPS-assembly protein